VIRHLPIGLGHPYRVEPFQRFPINPVIGKRWTLRVCTDESTKSVRVEAKCGIKSWSLDLTNDGFAKSFDPGSYGLTAKEDGGDSHLEDAALRSGDYPDQISWSISMPALSESEVVEYFFTTSEGESTQPFTCAASSWKQISERVLTIDGTQEIAHRISEPEWLIDAFGTASMARFSIALEDDEHVVGFGERFHSVDQRDDLVDAVVYEEYKGQGHRTYLPSTFAIVVGGEFGFHIKTSTPTRYDVGRTKRSEIQIEVDLLPGQREIGIDLFSGDPTQVLNQYLNLVGKPTPPPEWIYSLWQSSNEWNTQERVESEISESLQAGIEPGVVVIEAWSDESTFTVFRDAQYSPTDGVTPLKAADISYPGSGAWPDPKAMIDAMHSKGIRLLLWQIPVLKDAGEPGSQAESFWNYAEKNDLVVRQSDGTPYLVRGFWFKDGMLPDFTDPEVRRWWADQRRYLVDELGVDGFKTDGGEHAWGGDLLYVGDAIGLEKNNLFPVHYAQTFHELMKSCHRDPDTFSRAGFTGSSAFPTFWAGDENSTWQAFRASINAGITASASGFFSWGWDIGGFSGDIPSVELYLRGTAMATFCPIMQFHSEFNHHQIPSNDRSPWNLAKRHNTPELLTIFKGFADLRKQLLLYLVEEGEIATEMGRPLMAGLFFDYAEDQEIWLAPHQYMLGRSLLVCPVTEPDVTEWNVYLPEGDWIDFWDLTEHQGRSWIKADAPLNRIPIFIAKGETDRLIRMLGL
jgi:alpha-glucosidase (family GH31 glycosyl hydrolase)